MSTISGFSILLHDVISLPDAMSCDKNIFYLQINIVLSKDNSYELPVYVLLIVKLLNYFPLVVVFRFDDNFSSI